MIWPSIELLTANSSFLTNLTAVIADLCTLCDVVNDCTYLPRCHNLTSQSDPPVKRNYESMDKVKHVTPRLSFPRCASWIMNISLPDCGVKARILPSVHPVIMDRPSGMNSMQLAVTEDGASFSTLMVNNSF